MKIQIINGPNINLLGKREPSVYGSRSFDDYLDELKKRYPEVDLFCYQSNVEGEMINKIHEVGFDYDGIVLNVGAASHPDGTVVAPEDSAVPDIHMFTQGNVPHHCGIGGNVDGFHS